MSVVIDALHGAIIGCLTAIIWLLKKTGQIERVANAIHAIRRPIPRPQASYDAGLEDGLPWPR